MDRKNNLDKGYSSDSDNPDSDNPVISERHFAELQRVMNQRTNDFQSTPLPVAPNRSSPHSRGLQASFGDNSSNTALTPARASQQSVLSRTAISNSPYHLSTLFGNLSLDTFGSPAGVGQHGSLPVTPDLQSPHLHGISALSGNDSAPSSGRNSRTGRASRSSGAIPKTKSRKSGGGVPYQKCPRKKLDFCRTGEKSSSMESSPTTSRPGSSLQVQSTSFAGSSGASGPHLNYNLPATGSIDLLNMDDLLQNFRALSVSYHNQCSSRRSGPSQVVESADRVFEALGRILRTVTSLLGYSSLETAMQNTAAEEQSPITLLWLLYSQLEAMRDLPEAAQYLSVVSFFSPELNQIPELVRYLEPNLRMFFQSYHSTNVDEAREMLRSLVRDIKEFVEQLVSVLCTFGTNFMSSVKGEKF